MTASLTIQPRLGRRDASRAPDYRSRPRPQCIPTTRIRPRQKQRDPHRVVSARTHLTSARQARLGKFRCLEPDPESNHVVTPTPRRKRSTRQSDESSHPSAIPAVTLPLVRGDEGGAGAATKACARAGRVAAAIKSGDPGLGGPSLRFITAWVAVLAMSAALPSASFGFRTGVGCHGAFKMPGFSIHSSTFDAVQVLSRRHMSCSDALHIAAKARSLDGIEVIYGSQFGGGGVGGHSMSDPGTATC